MTDSLTQRMNEVLHKINSTEFLSSKGLGNEIAFYIFDYPPEEELRIREHIQFLITHIPKNKPGLRFIHVNLFNLIVDYLKQRNLLDKSFQKQKHEGDAALAKVIQQARQTNTPVIIWEENHIKEIPAVDQLEITICSIRP